MFGIFFALLVAMALLNVCGEVTTRVRLTRKENSRGKLGWWRRGGDEVAATYEQLFPESWLPFFRAMDLLVVSRVRRFCPSYHSVENTLNLVRHCPRH
jgi:hypothetical protein